MIIAENYDTSTGLKILQREGDGVGGWLKIMFLDFKKNACCLLLYFFSKLVFFFKMTTVIEKSQSMSAYSPVSDHCLMIVLIYFLDNTFFFLSFTDC